MNHILPGSSVHGISQAGILDGLPFPSPGDLPDPGNEPRSPALVGRFFTTELQGSPYAQVASVQFNSVAQSCPTLCNPMNCSTPGLPVHHQLPEFTQTHVHRVGDAIQPSHPLLSPSPPAPNPSSIRVFSNESTLHIRWPKYWSFSINPSNKHPGPISFRMNWLDLLVVQGTLKSFPTPQFKSISSLVLSLLHGSTLTSIHDHWKNHSLD